MGLAIAAEVSKRHPVVVVDAEHAVRSSWGDSRGLQYQYDGVYRGMINRAGKLWHKMQAEQDAAATADASSKPRPLFTVSGNLWLGPLTEAVDTLASYHDNGRTEACLLPARQVHRRFPALRLANKKHVGVFDPGGLALSAVDCLHAFERTAERNGATFARPDTAVRIDRARLEVHTADGRVLPFSTCVIAAGPWTNKVLGAAGLAPLPLFVSAEQTLYLEPPDTRDAEQYFHYKIGGQHGLPIIGGPVGAGDGKGKACFVYAVPQLPGSAAHVAVKVAAHMQGELLATTDFWAPPGVTTTSFPANTLHRRDALRLAQPADDELDEYQVGLVARFLAQCLPELRVGRRLMVNRCLYTNPARQDSAEDFSRLNVPRCAAMGWILIPVHCSANS